MCFIYPWVVWMIIGGVAMYLLTYFFLKNKWGIHFLVEKNLLIVGSISFLALPILNGLFYRDVLVRYWEAGKKNTPRTFFTPWREFNSVMIETPSVIRKLLATYWPCVMCWGQLV
jgi:hypothetical protein